MFVSFAMVVRFWHHNVLDADDRQWLKQIGDVVNNREDRLPPVGRTTPDRSCCSSRWWLACCCSCCPAS
jgi:cytochrome b subunit of formate dehydrogenase